MSMLNLSIKKKSNSLLLSNLMSLFPAINEAVEHRGGDKSGSGLLGPQQNLQTQAGNISKPYSQGELNVE